MPQSVKSLSIALLLAGAAACAGTKLTSAWKDPASSNVRFKKVLVAAMFHDDANRRSAEDQLAAKIGAERVVPSYSMFPGPNPPDKEESLAKIKAAGCDGAVILHGITKETTTTYVPGSVGYSPAVYGGFGGYWGYGWGMTYSPGYVTSETTVKIEALVYDVKQDKLIWASRSETSSPGSLRELIDGVVAATVREMKYQKLIP